MRVLPLHRQQELETIRGNFACWAKPHAGAHQLHFKPSKQPRSQIAVPITYEMPVLKKCSSRSRESKGGTHTSLSSPSTSMQISPTTEFISSLVSPRNVNPRNLRHAPRGSDTKVSQNVDYQWRNHAFAAISPDEIRCLERLWDFFAVYLLD